MSVVPRYTSRDCKLLNHRISEMGDTEHHEIYRILDNHGVAATATVNGNGMFVNLSKLDNSIIDEIHKFVSFCMDNKVSLDEYEQRINECKIRQEYFREEDTAISPSTSMSLSRLPSQTTSTTVATGAAAAAAAAATTTTTTPAAASATIGANGYMSRSAVDAALSAVPLTMSGLPPPWLDMDRKADLLAYAQAKRKYSKPHGGGDASFGGGVGGASAGDGSEELQPEPYLIGPDTPHPCP
jgi:hypothetical protein